MQNIISLIFRYFLSLFPACAGVIPMVDNMPEKFQAFTRMCGGYPAIPAQKRLKILFSPHVRG